MRCVCEYRWLCWTKKAIPRKRRSRISTTRGAAAIPVLPLRALEPRGKGLRVALDTSVLLGGLRSTLIAGAALRYYDAYWSSWIITEFVRKRTEWVAERAVRDGCTQAELRQRCRAARKRLNAAISEMSHVLREVDYARAPAADLDWLSDTDDRPVLQTALAAKAQALITANAADFPLGQQRNGVWFLSAAAFISALYAEYASATVDIATYLGGGTS